MGIANTLVVMRHAKAEPYAETDAARRLTSRGRDEATAAGRRIAELRLVPEHALVSSAVRTRETWDAVREACGSELEAEVTDSLYGAPPDAVLQALRAVPKAAGTCLYIGHNPTAAQLVSQLDDGEADPEVLHGLLTGFPTSAFAVFELAGEWAELADGGGRLTHFHAGR